MADDDGPPPRELSLRRARKVVIHGLANSLHVIIAGRESLAEHVSSAEGREILADMEAADTKARKLLEALRELL